MIGRSVSGGRFNLEHAWNFSSSPHHESPIIFFAVTNMQSFELRRYDYPIKWLLRNDLEAISKIMSEWKGAIERRKQGNFFGSEIVSAAKIIYVVFDF